jgi:hypothetical protein
VNCRLVLSARRDNATRLPASRWQPEKVLGRTPLPQPTAKWIAPRIGAQGGTDVRAVDVVCPRPATRGLRAAPPFGRSSHQPAATALQALHNGAETMRLWPMTQPMSEIDHQTSRSFMPKQQSPIARMWSLVRAVGVDNELRAGASRSSQPAHPARPQAALRHDRLSPLERWGGPTQRRSSATAPRLGRPGSGGMVGDKWGEALQQMRVTAATVLTAQTVTVQLAARTV